ncbi:hypothetical protein ATANTOWER_003973 [Ataeniobius toweri]|uniref:Uncharacterized protein n=1 Tax=Ataeniobius toweri TaxID=208326 RepID=A0ABU7AWI2_9TELE|nr:hypothetical protein [Ataeniobius toweri]
MVPGRTLRRSEPQTSKGPPKHRNPRRTTTGTTTTPPEKSSGESQGNHPAATVQEPQRRAHRPRQQPSTPEQIQPWTQRPKNVIPFTIQRLCELLTEPKRNYTGTDKFLRGMEKNVMVVSCVHPTSEKNGCSAVNRMNGVMLPGNTSAFTERKVNGPGTPRPLNRPKVSLANSLAANGLPDSTDNKDLNREQEDNKDTSNISPSEGSPGSAVKNKHSEEEEEEEEDMEAEHQEVKRLKFCKEDEDEDDEQEVETLRSSDSSHHSKEAEAMVQEEEEDEKESEASSTAAASEEQEPSSSTQPEACEGSNEEEGEQAEREVPCGSEEEGTDMDQTDQQAPASVQESPETSRDGEESSSDPVSSSSSSKGSSCSTEEGAEAAREDVAVTPSSSTTEPPIEGATSNTETTEEPMEQD